MKVQRGSVELWRACPTGSETAARVSRSIVIFLNGHTNICKVWSLIKTLDLLMCNVTSMMPYDGCLQILRSSLKMDFFYRPPLDACSLLLALSECIHWGWSAATARWGQGPGVRDCNLAWVRPVIGTNGVQLTDACMSLRLWWVNPLRPRDAYMRQWMGHHWLKWWLVAWPPPSLYVKQRWNIVNWTTMNKLMWNLNRNSYIFIHEIQLVMSFGK